MKIEIEVKRRRLSVTQGEADVCINGRNVISFGDDIQLITDGEKYYGENIGGWASKTPDTKFITGMLYHPYDTVYHYSDRAKEVFNKILEEEKHGQNDI